MNELENTAEALKPQQILLSIENGITTTRANFDIHIASWANDYPSLGRSLELAKSKAEELGLTQVALDIERWVELHPWKAALYTTGALGLVAPEIFSIPALEALGFGLAGVRAGMLNVQSHKDAHLLIGLLRFNCLQDSIYHRSGRKPERLRNLAECTNGWLWSRICEWRSKSSHSFDGRRCCSLQSVEGL